MRDPHRQIWPWLAKAERTSVARFASLASQSANTSVGFLPPISSDSFLNFGATLAAIAARVRVLPVNEIALISACSISAWPARGPVPWTILSTPAGRPASTQTSPNIDAVNGVTSDGLATTVFPAASAGAIFQVNRYSGRFHGEMQPTTPSGWRKVHFSASRPRGGAPLSQAAPRRRA